MKNNILKPLRLVKFTPISADLKRFQSVSWFMGNGKPFIRGHLKVIRGARIGGK